MADEAEPQFLYLTTTGWKTGRPHEIEIWFTAHGGRHYVIAERRERAHWVQNLLRQPLVTWRVGGRTFVGRARPLRGESDADLLARVRALSDAKYGWSDGLVVELAPGEA